MEILVIWFNNQSIRLKLKALCPVEVLRSTFGDECQHSVNLSASMQGRRMPYL